MLRGDTRICSDPVSLSWTEFLSLSTKIMSSPTFPLNRRSHELQFPSNRAAHRGLQWSMWSPSTLQPPFPIMILSNLFRGRGRGRDKKKHRRHSHGTGRAVAEIPWYYIVAFSEDCCLWLTKEMFLGLADLSIDFRRSWFFLSVDLFQVGVDS